LSICALVTLSSSHSSGQFSKTYFKKYFLKIKGIKNTFIRSPAVVAAVKFLNS